MEANPGRRVGRVRVGPGTPPMDLDRGRAHHRAMASSADPTTASEPNPPPPPPPGPPPGPASPRLTRSRTDRVAGGVAGGLGRYFGVDPILFRIAFVALTIAGGAGVALYGVAWLLLPEDGEHDSNAAEVLRGHRSARYGRSGRSG